MKPYQLLRIGACAVAGLLVLSLSGCPQEPEPPPTGRLPDIPTPLFVAPDDCGTLQAALDAAELGAGIFIRPALSDRDPNATRLGEPGAIADSTIKKQP